MAYTGMRGTLPRMECPIGLKPFEDEGNMRPCSLPNCGHSISRHAVYNMMHQRALAVAQNPEEQVGRGLQIKCPICSTPQTKVTTPGDCVFNWTVIERIREEKEAEKAAAEEAATQAAEVHASAEETQETRQATVAAVEAEHTRQVAEEAREAAERREAMQVVETRLAESQASALAARADYRAARDRNRAIFGRSAARTRPEHAEMMSQIMSAMHRADPRRTARRANNDQFEQDQADFLDHLLTPNPPTDPTPTMLLHSNADGAQELMLPADQRSRQQLERARDVDMEPEANADGTTDGNTRHMHSTLRHGQARALWRASVVAGMQAARPASHPMNDVEREHGTTQRSLSVMLGDLLGTRGFHHLSRFLRVAACTLRQDGTARALEGFVSELFTRASQKEEHIDVCGNICARLPDAMSTFGVPRSDMKTVVLAKASTLFAAAHTAQAALQCQPRENMDPAVTQQADSMPNLCRFLGKLFLLNALPESFVIRHLEELLHVNLNSNATGEEHEPSAQETECVYALISTAGSKLQETVPHAMLTYIDCLEALAAQHFRNFHLLKFQIEWCIKRTRQELAASAGGTCARAAAAAAAGTSTAA